MCILAIYDAFHATRRQSLKPWRQILEEHGCRVMCLEEHQFKSLVFCFYAAAISIPGWLAIDLHPYHFGRCVPGHTFAILVACPSFNITRYILVLYTAYFYSTAAASSKHTLPE